MVVLALGYQPSCQAAYACQTAILSARRSRRQRRLTLLQEAANRGVALETDCDLVRVAGFVVCACPGQQLRACRPVGLVFGEPDIGGQLFAGREAGPGAMPLRSPHAAVASKHR